MIYAFDTNIISYMLKGNEKVQKNFKQEIIEAGNSYVIPPVVIYELWRWLHDNPTPKLLFFAVEFDALYQNVRNKTKMTAASWEKAAKIYITLKQNGELIDDADIFIAAYCIVNDYILVTNNTRHFMRIADLKHVDWSL